MGVPDYSKEIARIAADFGALVSQQACGEFTEYAAKRLHALDPSIGHLRKSRSQRQFNGHAVDALLHRPTGTAIDIIKASKEASPLKPGEAMWLVEAVARYDNDDWIDPDSVNPSPEPEPEPHPEPEPPAKPKNPAVAKPKHDWPTQRALGIELGAILGVPGSRYRENGAGFGELVAFLIWKVQFGGWTLDEAKAEARRRLA